MTVLKSVALSIRPGTIRALIGQNGSGKSTLIRSLAGDVDPDPGALVYVAGAPLRLGSPRHSREAGLRFVHQNLCVVEALSVLENVALTNGFLTGPCGWISWRAERARTARLLERFGLQLDAEAPLARYGRVEHAMVAIARAMEETSEPIRVMFLDEPTAALPPPEVDRLFAVLTQVRDSGVAIVYVTHRMDEVFRIADEITILRDGEVIRTCPTGQIRPEEVSQEMLGQEDAPSLSAPGAAARQARSPGHPQHAEPGSPPLLEVRGLRSSLLDRVDFTVAPGEVVGVAGLAGSGREELAAAVVGAVPSMVEGMRLAGEDVPGGLEPRSALARGVAFVRSSWQDGGAIRQMTVRENLTLASLGQIAALGWLAPGTERGVVADWMDRLKIKARGPEQPLSQLSGGNQQKVVIAKWMNTGARILLFDEPTAGVDIGARAELHALVRKFVEAGNGVVLASSDSVDFIGVCDRVIVLRHGRVAVELGCGDLSEGAIHRAIAGLEVDPLERL